MCSKATLTTQGHTFPSASTQGLEKYFLLSMWECSSPFWVICSLWRVRWIFILISLACSMIALIIFLFPSKDRGYWLGYYWLEWNSNHFLARTKFCSISWSLADLNIFLKLINHMPIINWRMIEISSLIIKLKCNK